MATRRTELRPVLDGDFRLLGPSPELHALDTDARAASAGAAPAEGGPSRHECVDHHIFQSLDGVWHLWGCIRKTRVGRILYHWEGRTLAHGTWRQTGELFRADREAGESLDDWNGEEWLQSPFVVQADGLYYMFYGAHGTGLDEAVRPVPSGDPATACQICLMTSEDGRQWTRHRNADGHSRLFLGPGEARDPCVLRVGGRWHLYYAGYDGGNPQEAGFYLRTSADLLTWSDWRLVHQDTRFGGGRWDTECPCVVYRAGYYYLFRTVDYAGAVTHVFRSDDPFDFGIGNAGDRYVGPIAVAAPEVVVDEDGAEFISSNHDLTGGTRLCRLRWEEV